MVRLSTARKLWVARQLRRVAGVIVSLQGGDASSVERERRGVKWSLDLNEGIQLALYLGLYERQTAAALARLALPGSTVIDIGANVGAHALPLARRVGATGHLVAIEPCDAAMARLRYHCKLNPQLARQVTLLHRALGDGSGTSADWYYGSWPVAPGPGRHPLHRGAPERSTAAVSTLDAVVKELGLASVDLIKLDVDGNELSVLRGARNVVARDHPTVVFELCPYLLAERREAPTALARVFLSLGYDLYDERTFRPLPDEGELLRSIPWGGSVNVVASVKPLPPV